MLFSTQDDYSHFAGGVFTKQQLFYSLTTKYIPFVLLPCLFSITFFSLPTAFTEIARCTITIKFHKRGSLWRLTRDKNFLAA